MIMRCWAGLRCSVRGGGAAESGHAESDRAGGACAPVDLGEFVFGACAADLESFGFAEPAFAVGFGDAGGEVVADLGDAVPLGGVGPAQGASQAPLTEPTGRPRRFLPRSTGSDAAAGHCPGSARLVTASAGTDLLLSVVVK